MGEAQAIQQHPQTYIGDVQISHNHGQITLKNATWYPYPVGKEHYNADGTNGYLEGEVVSGGHTSRLFWATSHTPLEVGSIRREDYCPISRIHPLYNNPSMKHISTCTCG